MKNIEKWPQRLHGSLEIFSDLSLEHRNILLIMMNTMMCVEKMQHMIAGSAWKGSPEINNNFV